MSALVFFGGIAILFLILVFVGTVILTMRYRGWSTSWWEGMRVAMAGLAGHFYHEPRDAWRAWHCRRARRYLMKYDHRFRSQEAGREVSRRRMIFDAQGGSPMSPDYPERDQVLAEWGFSE